jgi:allophanate hydrolase subunit 1
MLLSVLYVKVMVGFLIGLSDSLNGPKENGADLLIPAASSAVEGRQYAVGGLARPVKSER